MNYIVLSEVEAKREWLDMTFAVETAYMFDPPLETEAEDVQTMCKLAEERVLYGLSLYAKEPEPF